MQVPNNKTVSVKGTWKQKINETVVYYTFEAFLKTLIIIIIIKYIQHTNTDAGY